MTDENDRRNPSDRWRTRRSVLRKGLGIAGAALAPVGATVTTATRTQGRPHRFEIRAAADVEFTYHAKVGGPVSRRTQSSRETNADADANADHEGTGSVDRLPDGSFHIKGTTGFGATDRWEITRLHGFWATTAPDNYTLVMDGDEFEWYGLDTRLPPDFKFFEIRAEPDVEPFEYEFTALTNATNVGSPSDAAAELFESDFVLDRGDTTRVRGATGRGESDTWMIGWGPGDPAVAVTDFTTIASRDEYTLFYDTREIDSEDVA